jgi:hypothetical protein
MRPDSKFSINTKRDPDFKIKNFHIFYASLQLKLIFFLQLKSIEKYDFISK